jgi:predicted metal-dependent hydrolase
MSSETIELGGVSVEVTRKAVKHVHLAVHPPQGRVTLVAPEGTRLEVARAYAISKLGWIRSQREQFQAQAREMPREYLTRESHYVWGRRYLLEVVERDGKPSVRMDHKHIELSVRPGSDAARRAEVMHEWHKGLLHEVVPPLIRKWEGRLGVVVSAYFLQRMKTKWGGCKPEEGHIRLNTELVKKPRELLDYVILHEMAHLIEPNHGPRFVAILDEHCPHWRLRRDELNALPLSAEDWGDETP